MRCYVACPRGVGGATPVGVTLTQQGVCHQSPRGTTVGHSRSAGIFFWCEERSKAMATETRAGRTTTLTLDREAMTLLRRMAPGKKQLGAYVSMLLHLEHARREERERAKE